ncbi:MAG: molybdate transport system ATP-binding protein [Candidatus Aldehydirespiratoraceae bacterium]|jgi:molybdate transport system ATP-binding protein
MSSIKVSGQMQRGDLSLQLDLSLEAGLTMITGANGAGKTSLLRLIAGLERLDAGQLTIDGHTMDDAAGTFVPPHQRSIAYVFQDHRLFPHLSARDNVAFPLRRRGIKRAAASTQAQTQLATVGLYEQASSRPTQLSVGQQQRVALARALATPADILLLDEPLAATDEESRGTLRELIITAPHSMVLWVTHDPDDADRGDRRIAVDEGRVEQNRKR